MLDRETCRHCGSPDLIQNGWRRGRHLFRCRKCKRQCRDSERLPWARFPTEQIEMAVNLVAGGMSYRATVARLQTHYQIVDTVISTATIHSWVRRFGPDAAK